VRRTSKPAPLHRVRLLVDRGADAEPRSRRRLRLHRLRWAQLGLGLATPGDRRASVEWCRDATGWGDGHYLLLTRLVPRRLGAFCCRAVACCASGRHVVRTRSSHQGQLPPFTLAFLEWVPHGYERCCSCCDQIFKVLKLFRFLTDRNETFATDWWQHNHDLRTVSNF